LGNAAQAYFDRDFRLHDSVVIAASLTFSGNDGNAGGYCHVPRPKSRQLTIGLLSLAHHPQRLPVIFSSFFIKYECLLW
jgi:hypothetical protein